MKQNHVEKILEDCGWFEPENLEVMELYPQPKNEGYMVRIRVQLDNRATIPAGLRFKTPVRGV